MRNVGAVVERVRSTSPVLAAAKKTGDFKIVGAVYDIPTAKVRFL